MATWLLVCYRACYPCQRVADDHHEKHGLAGRQSHGLGFNKFRVIMGFQRNERANSFLAR